MRIGILLAERTPEPLRPRHGPYEALYEQWLDGRGFVFTTHAVRDGFLPSAVDAADAWLVTGSACSVYDDEAWIPPLEQFVRHAVDAGAPVIGICFGHQLVAQALGGTVERSPRGWTVGVVDYVLDGIAATARLLAWHQDEVTAAPPGATIVGQAPGCRFAALRYRDRAYTLQGHPELTPGFVEDLLVIEAPRLPAEVVRHARTGLHRPTASAAVADRVEAFLRQRKAPWTS